VLEVFNFVCQLVPAAHEFQISLFGFRVLSFLRRNEQFDGFNPEPLGSCRHPRQRGKIWAFQSVPDVRFWQRTSRRAQSISAFGGKADIEKTFENRTLGGAAKGEDGLHMVSSFPELEP